MSEVKVVQQFNFYYDAGHGWLQVHEEVLNFVGTTAPISKYSYTKDGYVYLEEDCDAGKFLNKLKELGKEYEIKEVDHGHNSRIRNYRRYSA
jgi:hypothetical protein